MPQASAKSSPVPSPADAAPPRVTIRRYLIDDSVTEITELLHRSYAPQMAMGLRPLAGRQDDKTTLDRVLNSECYLALLDEQVAGAADGTADAPAAHGESAAPARPRIVGIILFNEHERVAFPSFFLRPDVSHFAMFGVEPGLQGLGIGRLLLERCEERARELGSAELALSMAEPDIKLRAYYEKRGYRFIEYWKWPYTNYRSCILSKHVG